MFNANPGDANSADLNRADPQSAEANPVEPNPADPQSAESPTATPDPSGGGSRSRCDRSGDCRPVAQDPWPERSPEVRHVLFGPEPAVRLTISNLHRRGYAEPNDWCKPQPTGQPGEVMSVLVKRVPLN